MKVIENKNFLSKDSKNFINNRILNSDFPLYYSKSHHNSNDYCLSHVILKRPEERNHNQFNSDFYPGFIKILNEFSIKENIEIKELCRIAVNLTFNIGVKNSPKHRDHDFDYKQIIVYLNDCDKNSHTVLLKNNKIYKKIIPEKYKGVYFGNCIHYQTYPKSGSRVAAIFTFK